MRIKRNYIVSKEKDLQARFRGFARAKRAVPLPPFYAPGKSRGSVFWNRGLFFFFPFIDSPMHFEFSSTKICSRHSLLLVACYDSTRLGFELRP